MIITKGSSTKELPFFLTNKEFVLKSLIVFSALLISSNVMACPDVKGTYIDEMGESVVISQKGCEEIVVTTRALSQKLVMNNQLSMVRDDSDMQIFGRGAYQGEVVHIEANITYKRMPPSVPAVFLPTKIVNNYSKTEDGDLLEDSVMFNYLNSPIKSTQTVYEKQN